MEVKEKLTRVLNAFLGPIRERRVHFAHQPGLIDEIVHAGTVRAWAEAWQTLALAREAMGLNVF